MLFVSARNVLAAAVASLSFAGPLSAVAVPSGGSEVPFDKLAAVDVPDLKTDLTP